MSDRSPDQTTEPPAGDGDGAGGFAELGLDDGLVEALAGLGYEEPTPIQRAAIPILIQGRDLLGQAATGTGKTAAFALPILERLAGESDRSRPLALILAPTRELAVQVSEAIYKYGRRLDARVVPIYGGQPIVRQLQVLKRGVDVVVATPGRALDHISRGTLALDGVRMVVLDEADEMLDMGFAEDIEAILQATPDDRQTLLFSATLPPRIAAIAQRHLRDPARIEIGTPVADPGSAPLVRQTAYFVARAHKPAALGRILDVEAPGSAIVFCRTRIEVDQLTETLNGRGYRAEALHGGMSQEQRDRVMGRLRTGTADLLVATDVAARGLDVDHLTHVVNYDVPSAPESYVHRIGRVGRAGREGVAITLAQPRERRLIDNIQRVTGRPISIERIPTVADLRARQIALTVEALRGALDADDLADYQEVVDALSGEADLAQIARAAVKLAHESSGMAVDDEEIPEPFTSKDRSRSSGPAGGTRERPGRSSHPGRKREGTARIYLGIGKGSRIRPGDLVGAITGETRLSGRDIGTINIAESHAIVEIPDDAVDEVIDAMRRTTIRGKKVKARRDRLDG
jgi:ATP-dependent RNA helicase DeaD